MSEKNDDQRPVAQHSHHEYEEEQHRHDVRLRPLVVGDDALGDVHAGIVSVESPAQRPVQAEGGVGVDAGVHFWIIAVRVVHVSEGGNSRSSVGNAIILKGVVVGGNWMLGARPFTRPARKNKLLVHSEAFRIKTLLKSMKFEY